MSDATPIPCRCGPGCTCGCAGSFADGATYPGGFCVPCRQARAAGATADGFETWAKAHDYDLGRQYVAADMRAAFAAGGAAERAACVRLCREWAAGVAVANDAEGRPLDPRQDGETAGDQLAEAIESRGGADARP